MPSTRTSKKRAHPESIVASPSSSNINVGDTNTTSTQITNPNTRRRSLRVLSSPSSSSPMKIFGDVEHDLDGPPSSPTPYRKPPLKRARTSLTMMDGDENKENVPPMLMAPVSGSGAGSVNGGAQPGRTTRSGQTRRGNTPSIGLGLPSSRSRASTPRRTLSMPIGRDTSMKIVDMPAPEIAQLTLNTPPPTPQSLHSRARALLRATSTSFVGREDERSKITAFLKGFIEPDNSPSTEGPSLYVSGAPGTGKTALVNDVLSSLAQTGHENLKVVVLNCMGLGELGLGPVWDRVMEEYVDGDKRKRGASKSKNNKAAFDVLMGKEDTRCVLVLDEIDHLSARNADIQTIFDLPNKFSNTLRVIGIANTHTLSSSSHSCAATTIHFAPYTAPELSAIISSRLSPIVAEDAAFIGTSALALLTRKVSSTTGDVRVVISTLLRAIDTSSAANAPTVSPAHILETIKKDKSQNASSSDCVNKVRALGFQARVVLCAFLLALKRLAAGVPLSSHAVQTVTKGKENPSAPSNGTSASNGLDHTVLHAYYCALLGPTPFEPVPRTELADVLGMLEIHGLVYLSLAQSKGRGAKGKAMIALASGVREEEVVRGLSNGEGAMEEEVTKLWDNEVKRINRISGARKAELKNLGEKKLASFDEAMEQ
ncbi:P-loop containing nucleoside triphosphate hydrolase protein [Sistotremastrum suecicum HHB10207 ss-3]|uniref:p-loop containing nucleoside triphosphate hydrolase protein n=1 Tax=Sistotremastrum suecicum HHB10207 ss-3 TaxID=1314776 RepID=A0A166CJW5_9AGAM|nr:P-loop containing nucleoside triphosphate hydrolase protein [Sistotremastrum suecicum HHB10207 ss-3]